MWSSCLQRPIPLLFRPCDGVPNLALQLLWLDRAWILHVTRHGSPPGNPFRSAVEPLRRPTTVRSLAL